MLAVLNDKGGRRIDKMTKQASAESKKEEKSLEDQESADVGNKNTERNRKKRERKKKKMKEKKENDLKKKVLIGGFYFNDLDEEDFFNINIP